jgi:ribosomal-protein-alanine N-acetyltransferase
MKIKKPLVGDRLILRSLVNQDVNERYLSWLSDFEVIRHLEIRFSSPGNIEDLGNFINLVNNSADTLMLGMFLRLDGRHIGNIKLGPINSYHANGDIGLLIGERSEWGKGYASDAIKLLSDFAFAELGLIKLTAGCYSSNDGSRRAFLKSGFLEEGRRVAQYIVDDHREDAVLLGKLSPSIGSIKK